MRGLGDVAPRELLQDCPESTRLKIVSVFLAVLT